MMMMAILNNNFKFCKWIDNNDVRYSKQKVLSVCRSLQNNLIVLYCDKSKSNNNNKACFSSSWLRCIVNDDDNGRMGGKMCNGLLRDYCMILFIILFSLRTIVYSFREKETSFLLEHWFVVFEKLSHLNQIFNTNGGLRKKKKKTKKSRAMCIHWRKEN